MLSLLLSYIQTMVQHVVVVRFVLVRSCCCQSLSTTISFVLNHDCIVPIVVNDGMIFGMI